MHLLTVRLTLELQKKVCHPTFNTGCPLKKEPGSVWGLLRKQQAALSIGWGHILRADCLHKEAEVGTQQTLGGIVCGTADDQFEPPPPFSLPLNLVKPALRTPQRELRNQGFVQNFLG